MRLKYCNIQVFKSNSFIRVQVWDWFRNFALTAIHPTNNKFAMKVFGSRKALQKERVRCMENPWIIHPYSLFRFEKDKSSPITIFLEVLVNLLTVPVIWKSCHDLEDLSKIIKFPGFHKVLI